MYYSIYVGWEELPCKEGEIHDMGDRWHICRVKAIKKAIDFGVLFFFFFSGKPHPLPHV